MQAQDAVVSNVFHASSMGMAIIDASCELVEVNEAFARLYESKVSVLKDHNMKTLMQQRHGDQLGEAVHSLLDGEVVGQRMVVDLTLGENQSLPAILNLSTIEKQTGTVLVIFENVSSKLELPNTSVSELESYLDLLSETSKVAMIGVGEFDFTAYTVFWSKSIAYVFGGDTPPPDLNKRFNTREQLINEYYRGLEFFRADYREALRDEIRLALEKGIPWDREVIVVPVEGVEFWVRTIGLPKFKDGQIFKIQILMQNITEKVNALKAIEDSARNAKDLSELLEETASVAGIGVWEIDLLTNKGFWSRSILDLFEVHDLPDFAGSNGSQTNTDVDMEDYLKRAFEFYDPGYREQITQAFEAAVGNQKPWDLEVKITTAKERTIWARTIGIPITENGKTLKVRALVQNISLQKEAQEILDQDNRALEIKIKERTQELSSTNESLAQARLDLEQQLSTVNRSAIVSETDLEGNITYVNDLFCEISKYSREELIGKNHNLLKSGLQPEGLFKGMWAAISKGIQWHGEILNRAKDGTYYWVDTTISPFKDAQGNIIKYFAVRFDITKQKQKQELILNQAEQLTFSGSFQYDANMDVVICSDNLLKILDVRSTSNQLSLKRFVEQVKEEDRKLFEQEITAAIAERRPVQIQHRYQLQHETRYARVILAPDKTSSDLYFGTMVDITAEFERSTVTSEIQENERKRISRELHDSLGQKLSVSKMYLDQFRNSHPTDPSLEKIHGLVHDAVLETRMISRGLSTKMVEDNGLTFAIKQLLETIPDHVEKYIDIEIEDNTLSNHTANNLYRILQEAMVNSLKHAVPSSITLNLEQDKDFVYLVWSDAGSGFELHQDQIRGNGLKNMQQRAISCNGTFNITSKPGKGTIIEIKVPPK